MERSSGNHRLVYNDGDSDPEPDAEFLNRSKAAQTLCLLFDVISNISTSRFASTPRAFAVFLQLTRYINCLL